jgi:hypothetical protein
MLSRSKMPIKKAYMFEKIGASPLVIILTFFPHGRLMTDDFVSPSPKGGLCSKQ